MLDVKVQNIIYQQEYDLFHPIVNSKIIKKLDFY